MTVAPSSPSLPPPEQTGPPASTRPAPPAGCSPASSGTANGGEEVLPLEEALVELAEAEEERGEADEALAGVLAELGVETPWR